MAAHEPPGPCLGICFVQTTASTSVRRPWADCSEPDVPGQPARAGPIVAWGFQANKKPRQTAGFFVVLPARNRSAETTGRRRGEQDEFAAAILAPGDLIVTEFSGLVFAETAGHHTVGTDADSDQRIAGRQRTPLTQ
jgi:hypothetical protein